MAESSAGGCYYVFMFYLKISHFYPIALRNGIFSAALGRPFSFLHFAATVNPENIAWREKFFMPAEWDILWLKCALVAVIRFLCFISKYPTFIALRCVMGYFGELTLRQAPTTVGRQSFDKLRMTALRRAQGGRQNLRSVCRKGCARMW